MAAGAETVRFSVTLSSGLLSRLDAVASGEGVTRSAVIEAVLGEHLGSYPALSKKNVLASSGESRDARTARLQQEGREAQARRDALIGAGR